jgi:hypothetical protein
MFLGSFFRIVGFTVNAGLVFLLSPQEPPLPWHDREPVSVWHQTRSTIFKGLRKVKMDLDRSRGEQITRKGERAPSVEMVRALLATGYARLSSDRKTKSSLLSEP